MRSPFKVFQEATEQFCAALDAEGRGVYQVSLYMLAQDRHLELTQAGVPWASDLKAGFCYSVD